MSRVVDLTSSPPRRNNRSNVNPRQGDEQDFGEVEVLGKTEAEMTPEEIREKEEKEWNETIKKAKENNDYWDLSTMNPTEKGGIFDFTDLIEKKEDDNLYTVETNDQEQITKFKELVFDFDLRLKDVDYSNKLFCEHRHHTLIASNTLKTWREANPTERDTNITWVERARREDTNYRRYIKQLCDIEWRKLTDEQKSEWDGTALLDLVNEKIPLFTEVRVGDILERINHVKLEEGTHTMETVKSWLQNNWNNGSIGEIFEFKKSTGRIEDEQKQDRINKRSRKTVENFKQDFEQYIIGNKNMYLPNYTHYMSYDNMLDISTENTDQTALNTILLPVHDNDDHYLTIKILQDKIFWVTLGSFGMFKIEDIDATTPDAFIGVSSRYDLPSETDVYYIGTCNHDGDTVFISLERGETDNIEYVVMVYIYDAENKIWNEKGPLSDMIRTGAALGLFPDQNRDSKIDLGSLQHTDRQALTCMEYYEIDTQKFVITGSYNGVVRLWKVNGLSDSSIRVKTFFVTDSLEKYTQKRNLKAVKKVQQHFLKENPFESEITWDVFKDHSYNKLKLNDTEFSFIWEVMEKNDKGNITLDGFQRFLNLKDIPTDSSRLITHILFTDYSIHALRDNEVLNTFDLRTGTVQETYPDTNGLFYALLPFGESGFLTITGARKEHESMDTYTTRIHERGCKTKVISSKVQDWESYTSVNNLLNNLQLFFKKHYKCALYNRDETIVAVVGEMAIGGHNIRFVNPRNTSVTGYIYDILRCYNPRQCIAFNHDGEEKIVIGTTHEDTESPTVLIYKITNTTVSYQTTKEIDHKLSEYGINIFKDHSYNIMFIAFSPKQKDHLVLLLNTTLIGRHHAALYVLDTATKKEVGHVFLGRHRFLPDDQPSCAMSPDGNWVACSIRYIDRDLDVDEDSIMPENDFSVILCNVTDFKVQHVSDKRKKATCISFGNEEQVQFATVDGGLHLWDVANRMRKPWASASFDVGASLVASHTLPENFIYAIACHNVLKVGNDQKQKSIPSGQPHAKRIGSIQFNHDDTRILCCREDSVDIYDLSKQIGKKRKIHYTLGDDGHCYGNVDVRNSEDRTEVNMISLDVHNGELVYATLEPYQEFSYILPSICRNTDALFHFTTHPSNLLCGAVLKTNQIILFKPNRVRELRARILQMKADEETIMVNIRLAVEFYMKNDKEGTDGALDLVRSEVDNCEDDENDSSRHNFVRVKIIFAYFIEYSINKSVTVDPYHRGGGNSPVYDVLFGEPGLIELREGGNDGRTTEYKHAIREASRKFRGKYERDMTNIKAKHQPQEYFRFIEYLKKTVSMMMKEQSTQPESGRGSSSTQQPAQHFQGISDDSDNLDSDESGSF